MNQPFDPRSDESRIASTVIIDAGLTLPEGFGERSQKVADLLERRLSRLEKELNLPEID